MRHCLNARAIPDGSLHPETSLFEAAACVREEASGCLPVTQDGKLVGAVTRVALAALGLDSVDAEPVTPSWLHVADVMTRCYATCDSGASMKEATSRLLQLGVDSLLVVDTSGRVAGVLRVRDVLEFVANGGAGEAGERLVANVLTPVTTAGSTQELCNS